MGILGIKKSLVSLKYVERKGKGAYQKFHLIGHFWDAVKGGHKR